MHIESYITYYMISSLCYNAFVYVRILDISISFLELLTSIYISLQNYFNDYPAVMSFKSQNFILLYDNIFISV